MKQLTVYLGAASSYYHFLEPMVDAVKAGQPDFLAIVPVNRAVRKLKRTLIDQAKEKALADPNVFTFDSLLLELYRFSPKAKRLISHEMFLVLVKDILSKHPDEFSYFMPDQQLNDGLVQKVADALSELRNFSYDSQQFLNIEVEDRSLHPQKYQAFGRLLTLLEQQFAQQLIDEPFARAQAAQNLTQDVFRRRFPRVKILYISGYGIFSPPMLTFIDRVAQWMPVNIKLDYLPQNPVLFSHTKEALRHFEKLEAIIKKTPNGHSMLANHLFNRQHLPETPLPLNERLFVAGLNNREQEVAFIAGQIRALNRAGIPLHRLAVTFSHLEKYVPLLRRVFDDYGIPFNLSTGFEVAKAPLIATFLGLFRLINENFPLEKTLGLLSNPLVKTPENFNIDLVRRLCFKTKTTHLDQRHLKRLQDVIENHWPEAAQEEIPLDRQSAQENIVTLQQLLQPLFAFPKKGTAVELRTHFLELLNHYDLIHWYKSDFRHLTERQKESNFRAYNRFVKIFERTIWTLKIIHGEQAIELGQMFGALQSALERELYNLTEWQDYGIQIMPRLEILAVTFDVLFVGGLIDGDFPRSSVKDIFFGDDVRSKMGLVASEELLAQDRFLFYQLLDNQGQRIYLTYPKYRDEEALVPSSFLADLRDVAQITMLKTQENDSLFENRQKLWEAFGLNINFLNVDENLNKALHQVDMLSALVRNPRKTLWDLLHRIRFASLRLMGNQFNRFEGNLSGNAQVVEDLQKHYGHRVWSITQLETYGFCPMLFYLQYVLKIDAPEKIEDEITPKERGSLLHKILFRFYSELRNAGKADQPMMFRERLLEIAREEFDRMPYQGLFWELEKLRYFGNENVQGIFDAFLLNEETRLNRLKAKPSFFELSFGFSGSFPMDPQSRKEPVAIHSNQATIRMQGRIDRVDCLEDGSAMIIDYKTGAVHTKITDIVDGVHFQLPLYLYVLPQLKPYLISAYGGLYQLKSADKCTLLPIIADKESAAASLGTRSKAFIPNNTVTNADGQPFDFDGLLQYSVDLAFQKIEALRKGIFRHTQFPDNKQCSQYCDYRRICQKVTGKLKGGKTTSEE